MQKLATQGQQMESKTFPFMDLLNEYDHFFSQGEALFWFTKGKW